MSIYKWLDTLLAEADYQLNGDGKAYELYKPRHFNELPFQPIVIISSDAVELQSQSYQQEPQRTGVNERDNIIWMKVCAYSSDYRQCRTYAVGAEEYPCCADK